VSSEDIAGAHGEVECGSCGKRFDALSRLCESLPMPLFQPDSREVPAAAEPGVAEDQQESHDEVSDEGDPHVEPDDVGNEADEPDTEPETDLSGEEEIAKTDDQHAGSDKSEDSADTHDNETDLEEDAEDIPDGNTERDFADLEETKDHSGEEADRDPDDGGEDEGEDENTSPDNTENVPADEEDSEDDRDREIEIDPSETVDLGEYDWQHTTVIQPQKPPPMEVSIQQVDAAENSLHEPEPERIPDYLAAPDAETSDDENPAPAELTPSGSATRGGWLRWVILGLLVVILLAWVHQARGLLARNSILGPALTGLYSVIGVDLRPDWDVAQFAILSSTASEDRRGNLVVTVTYTNLADFPQPYPTLRVVLEDRWGEALDVHYFEPREYLAGFVAGRAIGGGESATGETAVPSAGANAVGFSVDVCLKSEAVGFKCTSDL
jgi:hypothetical protein